MRAVDTNVVAQALLGDDPNQSPVAVEILRGGAFVSLTVLIEAAWLFRSRFGLDRSNVAARLGSLVDLPTITVPNEDVVRRAIDRSARRADLADLLHLAAAVGATSFATFDASIQEDAAPDSPVRVETLR